jgi:hypothetical protein
MESSWLQKFNEANLLYDNAEVLRSDIDRINQNIGMVLAQYELAIEMYKEILEDEVLNSQNKNMVQRKLNEVSTKFRIITSAVKLKHKLEMEWTRPEMKDKNTSKLLKE